MARLTWLALTATALLLASALTARADTWPDYRPLPKGSVRIIRTCYGNRCRTVVEGPASVCLKLVNPVLIARCLDKVGSE